MAKPETKVACPMCGRKQPHMGAEAMYYCKPCGCYFDDDPDEGGTYSNNPSRRLEQEERRREPKRPKRY